MQKHALQDLLEPVIAGLGYETVRILTIGQANPTLQVMIDVQDGSRDITVDDCAKVSRALSAVLDEKDPISGQYSLEVSSPGIDRPLTKLEHFKRFEGYVIKAETNTAINGRKRFKGELTNTDEQNNIHLLMDGEEYVLPFADIAKAKIVLTDELLAKYEAEQAENEF